MISDRAKLRGLMDILVVRNITNNLALLWSLLLSNPAALQELTHNNACILRNREVSFTNLLLLLTCYFFNRA
jgi:hypothetical protein